MMISKTFCVIPWVHVAINTRGTYRLCCNQSFLKEDEADGGYLDPYESYETPVEDMWNSSSYINTRVKMLNGEELPPCRRCYREEAMGMKSARLWNNEIYLPSLGELDPNGYCSTDSIKYIDVRLGNRCNLKCRMCNPYSSDQWVPDEKLTGLRGINPHVLNDLDKMDWFDQDYFWDNLFSVMDNCNLLYFSGGEPALFSDKQSVLFQKCIDKGIAKNMTFRYNTNLTIPLDNLSKYWHHFKEVRINCSIDGFGKVNDYIRYPSKWKNVEKNFLAVYNHSLDKNSNVSMNVMSTVQMYNIFGLIDLFEYLKDYNIFPLLNILNQPGHHNIRVLDSERKKIVADRLSSWYEENERRLGVYDRKAQFYKKLPGMIDYMLKEDWSHLYSDFVKETETLDKMRNQTLKDYIPEVCDE